MRWSARIASLLVCFAHAVPVAGAPPPLRGIAVDETLDGPAMLADVLQGRSRPVSLPLVVRLAIDMQAFAGDGAARALDRLDARVAFYHARTIPVVLSCGAVPATDEQVEAWRMTLRSLVERERGRIAAIEIGRATAASTPAVERYVYLMKLAAIQIRSVDADVLVVAGPVPVLAKPWLADALERATGYLNGVAVAGPDGSSDAEYRRQVEDLASVVEKAIPAGFVIQGPMALSEEVASLAGMVDAVAGVLGSSIHVTAVSGSARSLGVGLAALGHLADLLTADLVTLDERPVGLRLRSGGADVTDRVTHRLLYSLSGFATYLVYGPALIDGRLELDISIANASAPTVRDPLTGVATPAPVEREGANRLRVSLPMAGHALVLDFNYGAANEYTLTADARREALPRLEEIIFRSQQVQTAQDAALQTYTAHARIEHHFRPSPADPAYDVVTENQMFVDHDGVEWEELSFSLNGATWTSNRPPFPLLQPEKVLSMPLDLRLSEDYAYRLDGVDSVAGREAFVVRFEPADASRALYRGTVWIDRETYVRLKIQAVETHLTEPVASNDETRVFARVGELGGRPIWLVDRLESRQVILMAGRTILVERAVQLTDLHLNPSDFEAERSAARASDRIMYRDTDQGLRYFVKRGESRVVSAETTQSVRAFAAGADIDPSFDFPLPIGGLNILDFNFLHRNMQFALFYGGVIAFGNIQKAGLWGGKLDASVDFFGLALKSNDSVFDQNGERRGERVRKLPASVGVNAGYQLSPFQRVQGHYEFRYDAFFRDVDTAPDFATPSSTVTHGEGVRYEYRRRGYSLTANATAYQRNTWTPWGYSGSFDPSTRTYTQYDTGLSKDFVFATFHTIHLYGAYFGGRRLDRFSSYTFGLFDSARMHGVPSAVRFGELAMFRGSYSFNLFEQYRFDVFVDHALGREAPSGSPWRQVTGLGIGFNFRGPRSTIVRADVGRSLLPAAYRGAGSTVIQVLLLKPL